MSFPGEGLYALIRTECLLRLRRGSTWALFLLLCASAYLLMPDVNEGNTVFEIGGRRVLLTSAATSIATAVTGSLLLSLFGFYLVSNSIARDSRTGVGRLIASTPVTSISYLLGKFLGNAIYLLIVSAGFMIACMGMHLLRGEGPLEPLTFIVTFLVFFGPLAFAVAALALLFESVGFLSGRAGDVLYFFVWTTLLSLPAISLVERGGTGWEMYLDVTGMGVALAEIKRVAGTGSFSIGMSPFDASLPPVVFPGIAWTAGMLASRVVASFVALPLLALAFLGFRRFDPSIGRTRMQKKTGAFLMRAGSLLGGRWLVPERRWITGPPSMMRAVGLDVQLSLVLSPFIALAMLTLAIAALVTPPESFRTGYLPVLFFVLVPLLAGVSTRDMMSGTTSLIFSAPLLKQHFAVWKFLSVLALSLLVALVPLVRILLFFPSQAPGFLVGILFLASAATALGLLTGTPKTFVVSFLFFLYLVLNTKSEPGLDFAGWNGAATPAVTGVYAALALGMLAVVWVAKKGDRA